MATGMPFCTCFVCQACLWQLILQMLCARTLHACRSKAACTLQNKKPTSGIASHRSISADGLLPLTLTWALLYFPSQKVVASLKAVECRRRLSAFFSNKGPKRISKCPVHDAAPHRAAVDTLASYGPHTEVSYQEISSQADWRGGSRISSLSFAAESIHQIQRPAFGIRGRGSSRPQVLTKNSTDRATACLAMAWYVHPLY